MNRDPLTTDRDTPAADRAPLTDRNPLASKRHTLLADFDPLAAARYSPDEEVFQQKVY